MAACHPIDGDSQPLIPDFKTFRNFTLRPPLARLDAPGGIQRSDTL